MYVGTGDLQERFERIMRIYGPVIYLSAGVTRICAGVLASVNGHDQDFPEAREIDRGKTLDEFEKLIGLVKMVDSYRYRFC